MALSGCDAGAMVIIYGIPLEIQEKAYSDGQQTLDFAPKC